MDITLFIIWLEYKELRVFCDFRFSVRKCVRVNEPLGLLFFDCKQEVLKVFRGVVLPLPATYQNCRANMAVTSTQKKSGHIDSRSDGN